MTENIYASGAYLQLNPDLHQEDSAYKLRYMTELLQMVSWPDREVRVLDVGGGAGVLGRMVCEWFAARGHVVSCWAVDLSREMLALQRANNPYLREARLGGLEQVADEKFDLALLIDVIEHVPAHDAFAAGVNSRADYILYNVPIEKNLCDWLRDKWMRGRYYPLQRSSLGHVHFFSAAGARALIAKHHRLLAERVPEFARHLLETDHPSYEVQRRHRLRRLELVVSSSIRRWLPSFAPWLVQGSLFMLAKAR